MPDNNTPSPGFSIPPPPPSVTYLPDTGMPKLDDVQPVDPSALGGTASEYAKSISSGESITDLINDVQNIQAKAQAMLDNNNSNFTGVPNSPSPGGFNPDKAFQDLSRKLNPETASLQAAGASVAVGTEADYNRYKDSKNFQTFGYTPNMGSGQEYKYGNAMTWGDTVGNALAGGSHLAWDTFVEGWKGWGRMTEALFTWDSSKLMGSPEEREEMARKQTELMNKYAIYDTAESKDSIWNRQMFGNMLQQSGFAVGALAQFVIEEFLTAGVASPFIEAQFAGMLAARTGSTLAKTRQAAGLAEKATILGRVAERTRNLFRPKVITTAGDLINTTRQVSDVITRSEKVTSALANGLKALTPGYGTVEEMIKMNRAGAGFAQLAYTGLGGIKRGLSEFNMARSESIFEAASTYTQLKDRLTQDFFQSTGKMPEGDDLEKIKQQSENASHDNFWVNMGVLSVSNRIQFDNMFKQFSKTRSLLGQQVAELEGKAFQVTGKLTGKVAGDVAGKQGAKVYKMGLLGRLGAVPDIAKKFGGKAAAWEAAKGAPGLLKFEFAEGMQELIQTATDKGLEDYYADLYHGKKGYSGDKFDMIMNSIQNPFKDPEGMKTFLMGALTGRLISPINYTVTKISSAVQDRRNLQKAKQAYDSVLKSKVEEYTKDNGKAPDADEFAKIEKYAKSTTEYKGLKEHVNESIAAMNALYSDPTWLKKEAIANIKIQDKAAASMDEAASNHDRYTFNNSKDSALAKAVASSIKLNLYDSLRDMLKEHGANMSDDEFQQAFGMDASKENKGNAKKLTDNVVTQIEEYYDTFKKLKDEYGDRIMPELYKNNKPEDYKKAQYQKAVLDDVIEMLATNSYKAKQAIVRAVGLQNEMGKNSAIGASSLQILTKLGSDDALVRHKLILEREIMMMAMSETPSTPEQKEIYKSKIAELKEIDKWAANRDELINEAKVDKSYESFAALVNIFNKRAQNDTVFSKKDIEDNFVKFMDYIKLNRDNKKYIDAMNLLADPKNMEFVKEAYFNAAIDYELKAKEEQRREIEEATGVDIPRHEIVKDEDGTFFIKSPDGTIVEKGIATEEEAKTKAEELDAKYKKALEEEEAKNKQGKNDSDIEAKKAELEKANDEVIRLANLRANDKVVRQAIMDSNNGKITIEELDAVFKKWDDENGMTEAVANVNKIEAELAALEKAKNEKEQTNKTGDPFENIESFETSKGSVYTILPDGRTQRFKKVTGVTSEPSDLIVFVKFKDVQQEQDFLNGAQDDNSGTKVYVVDKEGNKYSKNSDIRGKEVNFVLIDEKTGNVLETVETKQEPTIGYSTYDERRFTENGEQYRSKHIGNEVTKINYKPKPGSKNSVADLLAKVKEAKTKDDLDAIEKLLGEDDYTDDEIDSVLDEIDKKAKSLKSTVIAVTLSPNDPQFVKPYYEALDAIEKILNKPGVTIAQARAAFEILRPILNKLNPDDKGEYAKKHNAEKQAVMERIKSENAAKDIEGAKELITNALSSDDITLNSSFKTLYDLLNLQLSPEFKDEAVAHFEKEYVKAVERKVNKLLSNVNNSTSSEAITQLINDSVRFKTAVQAVIKTLKEKSEKLNLERKGNSLTVNTNPNFTNPTHRSIINKDDGDASFAQGEAIQAFIDSGMLSQTDIDQEDEMSRHGASELINLGVARSSTLQVNKAAYLHFRKESNELKTVLLKYVNDIMVGLEMDDSNGRKYIYTKEMAKEDVDDAIATAKTKAELLSNFGIPETREVSTEEYKLLSTYRSAVTNLLKDSAILELLNNIEKHQEALLESETKPTSLDIIPLSLIKGLEVNYIKTNIDDFYADVIETFEKLKTVNDKSESTKLIKELYKNHFNIKSDGLDILKTLFANALQANNLLQSESDNFQPLTEEEIIKVLNESTTQSLNKEQIKQIEKYAKEEKLPEYKKRFQAAIGYKNESPIYSYEKQLVVTATSLSFNSLRPKSAADQRTTEDLYKYMMPDENGVVNTKLALTYIIYSEHSTPSEKELAKKLLEAVSDEDSFKVDNTILAGGEYYPETDEIAINLEAAGYKKDKPSVPVETVILHELVHSMIEKAIDDPNSEYTKSIKAVMEAVRTRDGANTFYAFQDTLKPDEQLREFVTEAFTNPAFQYLLATTPYKNTRETLWDKFIEVISNLLSKFGIDIRETALSETLSLTDQLLNKDAVTESDAFPSEKVMEEIKKANTKEDIDKIRKELEANKSKYSPDMYNALDAALKGKMKTINARNLNDAVKDMESIRIDKTTYYFKGTSKSFQVFKKGRTKINEVKEASVLAKIKEILDKRENTDEDEDVIPPVGKVVIMSDLKNKVFVEDPSTLDFSMVRPGETITAVEPNGLRSKGNDGEMKNGKYVETSKFQKYYYKIRNIINKLSLADPFELEKFYVTLDKDSEGVRWDGSVNDPGDGTKKNMAWKDAPKGVIGYISDAEGNPIVFNKEGKAIGKADKNNPEASRFNTGENQIVYFNTYTRGSDERSLSRIEPKSLNILFSVRDAVMNGTPHIGRLQKITQGQMVFGTMVRPQTKSQKNSARDKTLAQQMRQDNVKILLVNSILNIVINNSDGNINRQGLFTPSTRSIKVVNANGEPYSLFDHMIELMRTYHQMSINNDPNLGEVQRTLWDFTRNMWLTGDKYSLKIPMNFLSAWMRPDGDKKLPQRQFNLFTIKDGVITENEQNLKILKNHMNDMKINVSKQWLEENAPFKFPYITEVNGKKVINFEEKNYKDFLIDDIGLITYISDIPEADKVRLYNSSVHFLQPRPLVPKPPTIITKAEDLVKDSNSTANAVKNAVNNSEGSKNKNIPRPSKRKRLGAPSYEQTYKETYEKICN